MSEHAHAYFIEGAPYETTPVASNECGITREYISRLCKEGKVNAKNVNGQWFVDVASLKSYLDEQRVSREEGRRTRAQLLRREYHRHSRRHAHIHRAVTVARTVWDHRVLASFAVVLLFYTSNIFLVGLPSVKAATAMTFLTSGTTWTVPSDWNSSDNTIEVIGGGGGGLGNAGGGGGGYSKVTNLALTPGGTAYLHIGAGGSPGGSGGDTWFNNVNDAATSTSGGVLAQGGASSWFGGIGGGARSGVGTTKYSGGSGGSRFFGACCGGGGGGAAGASGNGNNGANALNESGAAGGAGDAGQGGMGGNGGIGTYDEYTPLSSGSSGANGAEWDYVHGAGGGGGGGASGCSGGAGGVGGGYGGGGGGGGGNTSGDCVVGLGGPGSQGLIIITYTPGATMSSIGKVLLMGM